MLDKLRERVRPFYLRNIYFSLFPQRKPAYFAESWRYPDFLPGSATQSRPLVFFWPMNDWHTRMQRTQHFAHALAQRGFQGVYLNPHLGRESPGGFDPAANTRVTRIETDLLELHVHLRREPVFHRRLLSGEESSLIAQAAGKLIADVRPSRVVQIVAFPVWTAAAKLIRDTYHAPVVYDCHDYLPGFSRIAQSIADREPETFATSDAVICSSASLVERAARFTSKPVELIRNATAAELLDTPRGSPPRITIGYIGALDSWFDAPSVQAAAEAHPEWQFKLIGRLESEAVEKLSACTNIDLIGEIPFRQLGKHLSTFSVGTIPFRLNPLIEATDPIKVYEYLAAGLPVVAANLPELRRFGYTVARYSDPFDFVQKLEAAVAGDSAALVAERRAIARNETWEHRTNQLAALLQAI